MYSKTCLKRPLKKEDQKLVFKTVYRLMQVKSIAECSKGSILQYFRPSLSYRLSLRSLFCLFLSGRLRLVLLYNIYIGMIFGYGFGLEIVAWENLIMIPLITVIIHQPVSHKINHWSLSEDTFFKLLDLYIIQINVLGLTTIHCISKLSSFCFLTCLEAYLLGL